MNKIRRDDRLGGKVAIVTGAGSRGEGIGNGRAAAILLARHGAKVALVDAVPQWGEATAQMIRAEGGDPMLIEADVTDQASCRAAVERTVGAWSRLDILVNNVGITGPAGTALEVDMTAWERAMTVNVSSMVIMARFAIPAMIASGGGSIVNISSLAGLLGAHPSLLYPTSKGAVINLTRAMAAHHGRDGIRVNCVAPGPVYTPMVYARGMSAELRERRRNSTMLGTEGTGWDIGYAVMFLASDEARWITGAVLPVDAGMSAGLAHAPVPPSDGKGE